MCLCPCNMWGHLVASCARRMGKGARDEVIIAKEKWIQRLHRKICNAWDEFGPDHGPVIRVPDTLEDRPKQGHNDASSNGNPGLPPHVPYHSASNSSRNSAEFLWSAATLDHRSISVDSSRTSGDPSEASDPSKNASSKYSWPKNRIVRQPKWLQDVPDKNIVEALKSRGVDGGFSIRRSQRGGDIQPYTLCVYHFKRVFKLEIRDENGCYSISQNPDMPSFEYLEDLVEHYRHNDLRLMRRTKEKFAGDANENTILIKLVD